MTAVLPQPATVSELDRLRRENTNLRAMNEALMGQLVSIDLCAARNWAEHPRTDAELDRIAAESRARHTRLALNTIAAKEHQ
jgi:hypothetical protein